MYVCYWACGILDVNWSCITFVIYGPTRPLFRIMLGPIWALEIGLAHLLFDLNANGYMQLGRKVFAKCYTSNGPSLNLIRLAIGLSP